MLSLLIQIINNNMTKIYYKPKCRPKAPRIPQIHSLYYKLLLLNLNKVLRKCWEILVEIKLSKHLCNYSITILWWRYYYLFDRKGKIRPIVKYNNLTIEVNIITLSKRGRQQSFHAPSSISQSKSVILKRKV